MVDVVVLVVADVLESREIVKFLEKLSRSLGDLTKALLESSKTRQKAQLVWNFIRRVRQFPSTEITSLSLELLQRTAARLPSEHRIARLVMAVLLLRNTMQDQRHRCMDLRRLNTILAVAHLMAVSFSTTFRRSNHEFLASTGMTPSHDGSMTPRHDAWNPAVTNTPARSNDFEFNLDESSPSPGYNPSTPGYQTFTPHTPGGLYSPFQPSTSPSPSSYQVNYTPSPGYSPQTMGAPSSPMNPQTPGAGLDSHGEWCSSELEVKIRSSADSNLRGQTGFITTVNNGACSVFLPVEDRVITLPSHALEPVAPQVQDQFKLIYGEDRETTGILLAIGKDATVLINNEKRLIPLNFLCKIASRKD